MRRLADCICGDATAPDILMGFLIARANAKHIHTDDVHPFARNHWLCEGEGGRGSECVGEFSLNMCAFRAHIVLRTHADVVAYASAR